MEVEKTNDDEGFYQEEKRDNREEFYQEIFRFLRNNWGKIFCLGIIITLYSIGGIPGFGLVKSIFGTFDAVVSGIQSLLVGSPGNCVNKKPVCGTNNEFSGSTCCPCANNDDKKSNMTCDNDGTVCCGCGNGCPLNKSIIQQLTTNKKIQMFAGIALGGFWIIGLIGALRGGKMLNGRTSQQSATLMNIAGEAEKSVIEGNLTPDMGNARVLLENERIKGGLSVEQRNAIDTADKSMTEYSAARESASIADAKARENVGDRTLVDDANRKKADAEALRQVAEENNKKALNITGKKGGK